VTLPSDTDGASLATHLTPVGDADPTRPLGPPVTAGIRVDGDRRPLTVDYNYGVADAGVFDQPPGPGLDRWAPLLPPLSGVGLGAGGTPLLAARSLADWAGVDAAVHVKDESRNPTWSHKDRLNRVVAGAAVRDGARGVVLASTGNHGAAAAAAAARNGLPCVVFTVPGTPPAMEEFVRSYGAAVLQLPTHEGLVGLVDALAEREFHAATSRTDPHTGHPWGPEGYKTIAYETALQLGRAPGSVFVPTAFAELLYGVWKGFRELRDLGVTDRVPAMVACEPATQSAHAAALERGEPVVEVGAGPSDAHSIGGARSTHRGYRALTASGGEALPVTDDTARDAQRALADVGLWQEFSAAVGAGGLRVADDPPGPVVVLACSAGYKDGVDWSAPELPRDPDVAAVADALEAAYGESFGLAD
jgi:threonine synthase